VRSFKRLRGDDAAPGSHSAYRITVRQLEALVRLSEAMARVFLSPVVTSDHVAEVRRKQGLDGVFLPHHLHGNGE
jgi:DNA replication licensing factor MCM6